MEFPTCNRKKEIGGGSRKFSKKLVDLTRNDPFAYGLYSSKDISFKLF